MDENGQTANGLLLRKTDGVFASSVQTKVMVVRAALRRAALCPCSPRHLLAMRCRSPARKCKQCTRRLPTACDQSRAVLAGWHDKRFAPLVSPMTENAAPSMPLEPASPDPAAASTPETFAPAPLSDTAVAPAEGASDTLQPGPQRERQRPRASDAPAGGRRGARAIPPALEQLASLYPQLFGAVFRPMKRGIFQELMAAHPELFDKAALKEALSIHARSTRYLQAVASGQQRHDLQGQPVEAMAPEHVHHALVEVYKRRKGRGQDDLLARLRSRIVDNMDTSGLTRDDYAALVRNRDEAANAVLDEALAELAERSAREEALLRTLDASGLSVEAFADMYGMDRHEVLRSAVRARARLALAQSAAEHESAAAGESGTAAEPADASTTP